MSNTVIAIDGPSASGKSTVARAVASALGFVYADSGALYRGITWSALQTGLRTDDLASLDQWLERVDFEITVQNGVMRFSIDGRMPDDGDLRRTDVVEAVSDLAALASVRRVVGEQLHAMLCFGNLVVDGRDIGTAVFPETRHKFFVDADPAERARRRAAENGADAASIRASLQRRDQKDRSRSAAPLRRAADALCIDTTRMTVQEVVDRILEAVHTAG